MCTNKTHFLTPIQDLIPTLAAKIIAIRHHAAKVGIKSCRGATECVSFVHICMQLAAATQL